MAKLSCKNKQHETTTPQGHTNKRGPTIPFSVSADKNDFVLDISWCGRVQPLNLCSERRPPIRAFVYQAESGGYRLKGVDFIQRSNVDNNVCTTPDLWQRPIGPDHPEQRIQTLSIMI